MVKFSLTLLLSFSDENSPQYNLSEFKRSRVDDNVEDALPRATNVVDPSQSEIAKSDVYAMGFEEVDDDPKRFSSAKQLNRFNPGKKAVQV